MAISRLLVLTVTLLSVPAEAEATRGGVAHFNTAERLALFQVNGQQGAAERIRRYQGDLAKTGPEARVNREVAVDSLFSMDHDVAHTVLQSYAGRGTDRRDVRRQVVGKLAIHLRNSEHAVFARSENASRYRRNYAKSLVQHFTVEVSIDPGLTELRNLAREALFALELGELRAAFDEMILDEDLDLRRRVLYAAGESRKLQLAPWIVEYIDDGEVGPAARTALANLTYTPDLDKRSFVDWWERNKGRTYMDLTEEAARGGSESAKAAKRGMDRRFFDMVDTTIELLVDTDKDGRWKEIAGYVEDVPPGMMQNTLRKLRDVLAPSGVTDDSDDDQERLDFFAELVGLYETPEYGDEVRALLLEVTSYLCVAGDQDQETRLVTALNSGNEEIATAALLGMSRFFSPANRREVVGVIRDAHENGKTALLGVAIDTLERTLKSGDWQAPTEDDEDLQEWIDGLFGVLEDESLDVLDAGLRQGVIDIFFESQNLMPVFNRFRLLVERDRALASLRRKMIPVLFDLVPPDSEKAELQALETLLELYEDAEPEIRLAAAKTYSGEILQDLREKLAQGIGDRLQLEDDNRVLGEFVSVLTQLAEEEDLVSTVNSRLRAALELVADENKAESLAKGLYEVAMQDDQNLTEWLRTCEILLELRPDRKLVWPILEKHRVALDTADTELQEKFARVVMDNAGLRPVEPGWRDASAQTEAKLVITWGPKLAETASYAEREEEKKIADRMIYLRCLAATEAYSALVTKAEEWVDPADILFSGRDLDEVRLLHAEGGLGQNQISAAWTEVSRVVDPNDRRSMVDVPVDIARQAAGLLREICEATDADMLEVYWPRFNIYLRLRYKVGEEEASELLRELNQWAEPRTASFTPETADELASLRALLSN